MEPEVDSVSNVEEMENVWIPLKDGCNLAARIWLPSDALASPVPAILEYLPYRKRDGTADRDQLTHPWFASHGYACIRVDMRGNGESDGLMFDEYAKQEQDDALEVISWISSQPWCSGPVGIMGISWGGFNGLQIAARRPETLKAVISLCSTDDRYADDIHYMGGALLNYNLGWASTMLAYSVRPPDPMMAGERWREKWLERLENLPFLAETWLEHQRRDSYWKHGSICENYEDIVAPVFLVGGWADGYSNTIFRMMEHLKVPKKALVGPWAHKYPHFACPGPQIGFLQEALRWWDHWLKGVDTGLMDEPSVKLYMQDSHVPAAMHTYIPGHWIGKESWPAPDITGMKWGLKKGNLYLSDSGSECAATDCGTDCKKDCRTDRFSSQEENFISISSDQSVGSRSGRWFAFGTGPDIPIDQMPDDNRSTLFDSPTLEESLEICGAPLVHLTFKSDRPSAILAARLCDVRPDGKIARISYGILNLAHLGSHENPEVLIPGKEYRISLQMNEIAWKLKAGHRIRLALSNGYWPTIWPSPYNTDISIKLSDACMELPCTPHTEDNLPQMPPPVSAPPLEQTVIRPSSLGWTIEEDTATGYVITHNVDDYGERIISAHGLRTSLRGEERWEIKPEDPLSARGDIHYSVSTSRGSWKISGEVNTAMWSDETDFYMSARVVVSEGEKEIFNRSWNSRIKRDLI